MERNTEVGTINTKWRSANNLRRESVLSVVPLKRILSLPPQMPNDWDPFGIHTVKAAQSAGIARRETSSKPMSLSFDSGRAVAQFLLLLRIPLSFLESRRFLRRAWLIY